MPDWGVALLGVGIGFFLNEISVLIRSRIRRKTYLEALRDELDTNLHQLAQKKDIAEQLVEALENGQLMSGVSVPFASTSYDSHFPDVIDALAPIQRDNIRHIYSELATLDRLMNEFSDNFREDHQSKVFDDVPAIYIGKVSNIIDCYDSLAELIESYLRDDPVDIYHRHSDDKSVGLKVQQSSTSDVSMSYATSLQSADEFARWIAVNSCDLNIPNSEVEAVSAAIFQHTQDIGDSILLLLKRNYPGPAFGLMRAHFESYVSGAWYLNYATEEARDGYKDGKYPKLQTMLKQLSAKENFGTTWILETAEKNLRSFHSMTHASIEHVFRRVTDSGSIEPSYPEEELVNLLRHTAEVQFGATVYLFDLAQMEDGKLELAAQAQKYRRGFPAK